MGAFKNWKNRFLQKKKEVIENELDDLELDDEEFFMSEEILGYDSCGSYTKQSCMNDCAGNFTMPTITTLN